MIQTKVKPQEKAGHLRKGHDSDRGKPLLPSTAEPVPVLQRKCACGGGCPDCEKKLTLQRQLTVGSAADRDEREADRIADRVMRASAERDEANLLVQRSSPQPSTQTEAPPVVYDALRSAGRPLDSVTRGFMGSRFNRDFIHVRVHADEKAEQSAAAVSALAYTVGPDIVFGRGQYAPASPAGQRLIAHELAHVVQQGASRSVQRQADTEKMAERKCDDLSRSIDDSEDVYLCTRPVGGKEENPFHHAFYRIGSPRTGCGPTYSLFPDTEASDCIQGIPEKDAEVYEDAQCISIPIKWSCLHKEAARYPWGRYCLPGPNSNTFVRIVRDACGDTSTEPAGGKHPGWGYKKPEAGKGTQKNLFGELYSYYNCEEIDCGRPKFGFK